MWLLFSVLSLCAYTVADLSGKKCVDKGNKYTPIEMMISLGIVLFGIGAAMYLFRLGESGETPWGIISRCPLLLVNLLSGVLYLVLFSLSMRFVGLSVIEAVSGASGVFYFVGLFLTNAVTGKLLSVHEMLHPLRLIPIILVLLFTALLPNVQAIGTKTPRSAAMTAMPTRRNAVIGLAVLLLAIGFDALDSIVTAYVSEEKCIGLMDYIIASFTSSAVPALLLFLFLRIKTGKWFIPFSTNRKAFAGYAVFSALAILLFMISSSCDATRTGILFISYPIISILGAKLFLKEKYTVMQNICIWFIALASIAFCISDYVI